MQGAGDANRLSPRLSQFVFLCSTPLKPKILPRRAERPAAIAADNLETQ